jgi:cyclin E
LPPLTWASNQELWDIMKNKIIIYKYEQNYLRKHPGIEPQMRAILLDWVMEIANAYRLHRQTFHLAVEYIDRFMSCTEKLQVDRLQLIGITALFIAAKVEVNRFVLISYHLIYNKNLYLGNISPKIKRVCLPHG